MSPTFLQTLQAHVGHQFHNTFDHLVLGLLLCALLVSMGVPYARAVLAVALFSLAREFLWQYPVRDAFALKLYDRLLDSAEFAVGASSIALFGSGTLLARIESVVSWVGELFVRAILALLAQIRHVPGLLGVPASPVAR